MKRFVILVLALAVAIPALADDLFPASFRGLPGSTFSDWTYDDPCGVYSFDPPENSWFVAHADSENPPPIDPCLPYFSAQRWGSNVVDEDPCMPWIPSAFGRNGLIDFAMGSWDLNNFIDPYTDNGSIKEIWIQITYQNPVSPGTPVDFGFGAGYIEEGDPCGVFVGVELVNSQVLNDDWLHDVFHVDLPVIPDYEWIEGGWGGNVLIDQVIIETWMWVPEPATMVLFGLGGLLMIRRRR